VGGGLMLSRVADRLFWMSRQMERAENTARILGVTSNLVLFGTGDVQEQNLVAPLSITGTEEAYRERHAKLTLPGLIEFMALDEKNPSSIYSCLKGARENAHAVRWQITSEMWETLNATWIEVRATPRSRVTGAGAQEFFDWVKERSHLFRGVTYGTIVRGEAFNFSRLGTFFERADNTARILDVKYYLLLPSLAYVGTPLDTGQWDNVLRSLSGERAYRWLNAGRMDARSIAEFLILDARFPRSLAFCYSSMRENLAALARLHGHEGEAHELMRQADQELTGRTIDAIFDGGLHQFLTGFIARNQAVASAIAEQFRFTA
jgi:uncharacterized alpha-E superfamily protein